MEQLTGNVFNIQRYTIHDGPGLRTELFLKAAHFDVSGAAILKVGGFAVSLEYIKANVFPVNSAGYARMSVRRAISSHSAKMKIS